MMNIKQHLELEIQQWDKVGYPALPQLFILRNGKKFKAKTFKGQRQTPKECFRNAALNFEGTYVEGYGLRKNFPLLIHHAWRVTEKGYVIDPTWNDPEECEYFGVPIEHDMLWDELSHLGTYGILDTGYGFNIDFMIKFDPGIKEIIQTTTKGTLHEYG